MLPVRTPPGVQVIHRASTIYPKIMIECPPNSIKKERHIALQGNSGRLHTSRLDMTPTLETVTQQHSSHDATWFQLMLYNTRIISNWLTQSQSCAGSPVGLQVWDIRSHRNKQYVWVKVKMEKEWYKDFRCQTNLTNDQDRQFNLQDFHLHLPIIYIQLSVWDIKPRVENTVWAIG